MPRKGKGFYFDRSSQQLENDCDQTNNEERKWGHHSKSKDEHEKKGILSEEIMAYYRQVSSTLEQGFDEDSPEAKTEFLNNVFSALKEECVVVSSNQTVSRILEYLFTHSSPKHLRPLFSKFCQELNLVVFDAFSSHVFQALIQYLPIMVLDDSNDGDNEEDQDNLSDISLLKESIEQLCSFMESHVRDIMTHVYGSHVLRSLLEVLGGVPVNAEIVRSRMSRNQSYKKVIGHGPKPNSNASKNFSADNKRWFDKISQKIVRLCNYEDHLNDKNYCPLLQSVLLILHKTSPDQYEEIASTIIQKTCSLSQPQSDDIGSKLPQVVQDEISSYLIELMLSLAGSKFEDLYDSLFKGKLLYYSVHPIANYVLQRLLSCIPNEDLMMSVYEDISAYIEDILAVNHCGIITKLASACLRTGVRQKQLIKALMSAFHCLEPESRQVKFVPLLASFQTFEVFFKTSDNTEGQNSLLKNVVIHGSLILQQLIQFSKPLIVVNSILAMSQSELIFLCCDKCGSHIIDSFFQSSTVKEKHKDAFIKCLQGLYINLACNRNGSRCLENIWKLSNIQQRVMIADDLCKSRERLEGDHIGKFILRNFALIKFKSRRKEWREIQGCNSKKQDLLKDILDGNKKKKKGIKKLHIQHDETSSDLISHSKISYEEAITFESNKQKKKKKKLMTENNVDSEESAPKIDLGLKRKKHKKKVKNDLEEELKTAKRRKQNNSKKTE